MAADQGGPQMHAASKHEPATPADQPGLIAPDTSGMNFYRADPALTDLLRLYLPDALLNHIEPHLDRLGELAGGHLDECARLADSHGPVLHQRDKFGRDAQWIEYHPAYRELEAAAFGQFGIHAMSVRKGILGWPDKYPVVAKHAFTFLFNQAEFGLGCPINVTDGCAKLLENFGSDALKARYLDGLTQTAIVYRQDCGVSASVISHQYKLAKLVDSHITRSATQRRLLV